MESINSGYFVGPMVEHCLALDVLFLSTVGLFLDRFNCRLVLAFILLGLGVMMSVVPLASNFTELLVISVILGMFGGGTDCGK